MTTSLEMAAAFVEQRFEANADGRLVVADDSPLFCLLRTTTGCLWRFRADLPATAVAALSKLAGREPPITWPVRDAPLPERLEPMRRILMRIDPAVESTRAFVLREAAGSRFRLEDRAEERAPNREEVVADLFRFD